MNVREIAQAANVSPATVSLVLNGRPGVKTDTRQRVAQLLLENGYEIRQTRSSRETVRLMFAIAAQNMNSSTHAMIFLLKL